MIKLGTRWAKYPFSRCGIMITMINIVVVFIVITSASARAAPRRAGRVDGEALSLYVPQMGV